VLVFWRTAYFPESANPMASESVGRPQARLVTPSIERWAIAMLTSQTRHVTESTDERRSSDWPKGRELAKPRAGQESSRGSLPGVSWKRDLPCWPHWMYHPSGKLSLECERINQREGYWAIIDSLEKRATFVPFQPEWVKDRVDGWTAAAGIENGPLFRSIHKNGVIWEWSDPERHLVRSKGIRPESRD
jgi:hypothetical protein